jgi:hypothetical protein
LAPSIIHYTYVSYRQHYENNYTYAKEEGGNTSGNSQHKDKRDDHRRARVADLEDVVDPSSGPVSYRSSVLGSGSVGIETDLNFEEGRDEGVGRAKRTKHEVGLDGGVGEKELDGEILLRLEVSVSHAIDSRTIYTYEINCALSRCLHLEGERRLKAGLLVEDEEGLVRSLRLITLCRSQRDRDGIRRTQDNGILDRLLAGESVLIDQVSAHSSPNCSAMITSSWHL